MKELLQYVEGLSNINLLILIQQILKYKHRLHTQSFQNKHSHFGGLAHGLKTGFELVPVPNR